MPKVPDYIVDPAAMKARDFFIVGGALSGFVSFVTFSNDGNGLFAALVAGGAFFIAAKIRVKRPYGGSIY